MCSRVFMAMMIALCFLGCSSDQAPVPHATPTAFNVAGAPTIEFNAPDMMCPDGCGVKVKEILSGQPGAKDVLVDFDAKKATVAIAGDGSFDAQAAVAALVDHGFKNSSVKDESLTGSVAKPQAVGDGAQ